MALEPRCEALRPGALGALKPDTQVGNTLLLRESRGSRDRV